MDGASEVLVLSVGELSYPVQGEVLLLGRFDRTRHAEVDEVRVQQGVVRLTVKVIRRLLSVQHLTMA